MACISKSPAKLARHPAAKLLKQLRVVAFERIPQDPTSSRYRQGATLGEDYKHWCRDKFGGGRFRLFFRYDANAKIIIYAWVNDENTLRTYGAKNDAYAVFAKILASRNPPDDWSVICRE
jgi:toxin YhaV